MDSSFRAENFLGASMQVASSSSGMHTRKQYTSHRRVFDETSVVAELTPDEKKQFHGESVKCVCSTCLGNEDACSQARCTSHRSEQHIAKLEEEDKEKKQRLDPLDATFSVSVTREQVEAARKRKEPKKNKEKAEAGGRKRASSKRKRRRRQKDSSDSNFESDSGGDDGNLGSDGDWQGGGGGSDEASQTECRRSQRQRRTLQYDDFGYDSNFSSDQ